MKLSCSRRFTRMLPCTPNFRFFIFGACTNTICIIWSSTRIRRRNFTNTVRSQTGLDCCRWWNRCPRISSMRKRREQIARKVFTTRIASWRDSLMIPSGSTYRGDLESGESGFEPSTNSLRPKVPQPTSTIAVNDSAERSKIGVSKTTTTNYTPWDKILGRTSGSWDGISKTTSRS